MNELNRQTNSIIMIGVGISHRPRLPVYGVSPEHLVQSHQAAVQGVGAVVLKCKIVKRKY